MAITVTAHDSVALIAMDDGRVNAINSSFCEEFTDALRNAKDSDAVVLTGRPRIFSAGLDLHALCGASESDLNLLFHSMSSAMEEVFSFPRPIISACSGHAIGGGAVLMLGCDERMGESTGRFHIHATGLGIPYPTVVLEIVTQALGVTIGRRALLMGAPVTGSCRQREGWIHHIVPGDELIAQALRRAQELSSLDNISFANTKSRLQAQATARIAASIDNDARAFTERVGSPTTQGRLALAVAKLEARRSANPR